MDCPSQLGTVIVPADMMNRLKNRNPEMTRGIVRIYYRDRQRTPMTVNGEDGYQIMVRNRGISAPIEFVLQ